MSNNLPKRAEPAAHALTPAAQAAANTSPHEIIEQWLGRVSPGTRRKYQQSLREFGEWAIEGEQSSERTFEFLSRQQPGPGHALLEGFRTACLDRGLAPGSTNALLTGLASLLRLARRLGVATWQPEGIFLPHEAREDRSGPTRNDMTLIVAHVEKLAERGDRVAVRDLAAIRLLHGCALRRNELCTLSIEHLRLDHADGPRVLLLRKGKRERQPLHVPPKAVAALRAWLDVRGVQPGPVFHRLDRAATEAETPAPLSGESVRQLLKRRAKAAGVERPVRPHGLRHSSATDVARTGSIARLLAFGGWSSPTSAARYLDDRDSEQRAASSGVEV